MANRYFNQMQYSLEKAVVHLFGKVGVGAAGAPTVDTTQSKGIKTVVRNSAGQYTITLSDTYPKFLSIHAVQVVGGAPSAPAVQVVSHSVGSPTPTIVVAFRDSAGVAADVNNGAEILLHIVLGNSSVF